MDVSHIIDALNDAQREAVTAQNDHLLVPIRNIRLLF